MGSKSNNTNSSSPSPNHDHDHNHHVVLFPFMSKGHTIPLIHLAHLLLNRHITVTFFTTPATRSFIANSLADTTATIVELPFPGNVAGIPTGVESTDSLASMSMFYSFAMATQLMKPDFDRALENLHPPVTFMVSDGFLWWTLESASKLGFPWFVFYGMSNYAMAVNAAALVSGVLRHVPEREIVTVPAFPWIKVSGDELEVDVQNPQADPIVAEFRTKAIDSTRRSSGIITNSFYELEPVFVDYWNREIGPKSWSIGPLLLAQSSTSNVLQTKPESRISNIVHQWLDEKESSSVLYVAFGSQAKISTEQLREIAKGLEESNVNFLWVIRKSKDEITEEYFPDGFENRVKNRGIVVKDWVDQNQILNHKSVQGFLSHTGWNSVLESICAEVPILAWPMMAEQPFNAKMVVEEIKVGLRVETSDGSVKGFVNKEELKKMVKELMAGEMGKEVRKKVKEVAAMAKKAMEEGGSSWQALESLINVACKERLMF